MGTPMSDLLMEQENAARQKQAAEAQRMALVAGGAGPQPPTAEVKSIQDMVASGTQNPDVGMLAGLLNRLFGQQPSPQPPPPTPVATPQPSGQGGMSPEEQRQATCLKETGQYCPD